MQHRNLPPLLLSILLLAFCSIWVDAQTTTSIRGSISDNLNAKVVGANVNLQSDSGFQLSTLTDESGRFEFTSLKAGSYFIEVKAQGFADHSHDEVRLVRGESKTVDIKLGIAGVNESVIVTATGTAQRSEDVAKVVSVVDSEDIEARHELSVAEALRGTAGLRIQQQGSPGSLTSLRLRGLRNLDSAILLDGLRVRDASDINGSAISLISDLGAVSIDRVEILRGSGSSIYGTHAIGGVVNLIPDGGSDAFHFSGGFEGGSLGTYRERLQASGGDALYGFNVGVDRLDVRKGIDRDDAYGNTSFAGRLQFHPKESITVAGTFYGSVANARVNDSPFALPGAFSGAQYPAAVAGATFQPDFNNPDQGRRNRLIVGSGRFSQIVNDYISYSVAYQRASTQRRNYNGPLVDPRFTTFVPFGDFEFLNTNRGTTDTLDGRVNLRFSSSNLATVGVEFERESFFQSSQPSFNTFNNTTDRQRTFALFGQDQFSLLDDRLRVAIGVRWQGYRLRAADRPGSLASRETESSVTGDGSIAYFFRSTGTKLRAHVGNGFRAPSLFERFGEGNFGGAGTVRFGDPTLRAEQSISVDGGFDQRLASDRVSIGATYFYTRLQRVVAFTGFAVDPLGLGRFSGYVNRTGGVSRGVETNLDVAPGSGMQLRLNYTFTNSDRFVPALGFQPEYVVPKHLIGLNWMQRYRALLFSVDINRTGAYLAPVFENSFPFRMAELTFDGYTKADVFVSYELKPTEKLTMTVFGGVENLFNETYYENGFLAPRVLGRGGVKFRF